MSREKTLEEIKAEKLRNRAEGRPKKTHATESKKESAKKASERFRKKYAQITITPPKELVEFLKHKGKEGFTKKSMTAIILEALQETSLFEEFKEWQNEK